MKIALTRRIPGDTQAVLAPYYSEIVVHDKNRPLTAEELRAAASDADVLICTIADKIDGELLAAAPKLKCVLTYSVGVDHIDQAALKKRKIPFSNTPDVLTNATADLAFSLILACARRLKPASHYVEEGRWVTWDPNLFMGLELSECILGIVGMGKIGQAVATRAFGFGMKVIYSSSSERNVSGLAGEVTRVKLEDLLKHSDIVSLHCPLTDKTKQLIGRRELNLMKERSVLVNTARGQVVDEGALLAHLRTHPEFHAGLDVFEKEPFVSEGLRTLPNAFCIPHIGSATDYARMKIANMCREEAIRFSKGESLSYEYR